MNILRYLIKNYPLLLNRVLKIQLFTCISSIARKPTELSIFLTLLLTNCVALWFSYISNAFLTKLALKICLLLRHSCINSVKWSAKQSNLFLPSTLNKFRSNLWRKANNAQNWTEGQWHPSACLWHFRFTQPFRMRHLHSEILLVERIKLKPTYLTKEAAP
jgi:hypothetical protein